MNLSKKVRACLLASIGLCGSISAHADSQSEYVDAVMDVMRTHVGLLRELSTRHHFKYSDNVVRHATAIDRTFGLLGPMEWHAAESAKIRSELQGTHMDLDEDHFEELGNASRKTIRNLIRAAHDTMDEYDAEGLNRAIDEFQEGCNGCHRLLPRAVAPDLWGKLKRDLSAD